jgi:hypothetical protein
VSAQPAQRLEKILARVAREQGLDQERLRRWVSFLALCGVLEQAVESGVIDTYYFKGGVAMELRFARAARITKDFDLGLVGNRAERIRKLEEVLKLGFDAFTFRLKPERPMTKAFSPARKSDTANARKTDSGPWPELLAIHLRQFTPDEATFQTGVPWEQRPRPLRQPEL